MLANGRANFPILFNLISHSSLWGYEFGYKNAIYTEHVYIHFYLALSTWNYKSLRHVSFINVKKEDEEVLNAEKNLSLICPFCKGNYSSELNWNI